MKLFCKAIPFLGSAVAVIFVSSTMLWQNRVGSISSVSTSALDPKNLGTSWKSLVESSCWEQILFMPRRALPKR